MLLSIPIATESFKGFEGRVKFDLVDLYVYTKEGLANELKRLNPDLIIGFDNSTSYLESEPYISALTYPILGIAISSQKFTNKDDNLYRIVNDSTYSAKLSSQHLVDHFNGSNALLIYDSDNSAYALDLATSIKDAHPNGKNFEIVSDMDLIKSSEDFKAYDFIYLALSPQKSGLLIQKIHQVNTTIPIVVSGWGFSPTTQTYYQDVENPLYFIFNYDLNSIPVNTFIDTYQKAHGEYPSTISFLTYEALSIVNQGINYPHLFKIDLKAYLKTLHNRSLTTSLDQIIIDDFGDCKRPNYLLQYIDEGYQTIIP